MKNIIPFVLIAASLTPLAKLWVDNYVAEKCYKMDQAVPPPSEWHPSCAVLTTLYADRRCPYVFVGCTIHGDNQWVDAKTQKPVN